VGYNTSGSVIFSRDPLGHETKLSYADSFSDSVNRNTFAYPTTITVTDDDDYLSMIQYNYNFGAVTRTEDPKGAATVNSYDPIGRLSQVRSEVNEAYTRYVYAPNHLSVQSFTTVNDLGSEFYQITVFNGHGKVRGVASDHPGSVGGYKAQSYEYDDMGRLSRQTNPTEINASWQAVGDDIGWAWSSQAYDWQWRPTASTNQDGTTKLISYDGCGCAGGQVVVTRDEVGRTQKIYSDALGRGIKTEELLSDGSVYRTITKKYNVRDQIEEAKSIAGSAGAFHVATNEYDGYGRLLRRKLPIEGANSLGTRYTYNSDDTVNTMTDPRNVVATYSYNGRGMVTMISFNDGGAPDIADVGPISFTYDAAGNRVGMIDDTGSAEYHYNSLSRIEWEKRRFNGLSQDYYIHYQYNLAGQIKEIKDPFNDVIYYNYDKAGQITSVTGSNYAGVTQYTSTQPDSLVKYRAWGAIKHLKYGNGFTTNIGYDARMQVGSFEINGRNPQYGPPLAAQAEHQYYADGRLRYSKDNTAHQFDRAFQYDDVGRVKEAYSGVEARNFVNQPRPGSDGQGPYRQSPRLDHWGNLISDTPRFWSQSINVSADFEAATGRRVGLGWAYDAAGNIIKAADNGVTTNHNYKYDARSLNVEADTSESVLIENPKGKTDFYKYDGDGRVGKRTFLKFAQGINFAPRETYYIYSTVLGGALLTELYWTGTKKTGYVMAGSMLLAEQNVTETATPFKYVNWQHRNPVTGSAGYSNAEGSYGPLVEPDALGINVGLSEPVAPPEPPTGSSRANAGIHYRGQGSCQVDGIGIDCFIARILAGSGPAGFAPEQTDYSLFDSLSEFKPRPGDPCSTRKDGQIDGIIGEDGKCHKALGGDNSVTIRGGDQDVGIIIIFFSPRDLLVRGNYRGGYTGGGDGRSLEGVHTVLDLVGLCPGFGEWADATNAVIYGAEGNFGDAATSAMATLPFLGWLATGGKVGQKVASITMDEAIEQGVKHVGGNGIMEVTGKGTNFQFRSTVKNASGQIETRVARFDINPIDPYVQQLGPHLNLETRIGKKKVGIDPHTPIDPSTIRKGDCP